MPCAGATDKAEAARRVTIPVGVRLPILDDSVVPRECGLALFDAFGSKEKTLHINPGGHIGIPDPRFQEGKVGAFIRPLFRTRADPQLLTPYSCL